GLALAAAATGCGRHGKAAPQGGDDRPPSKVNLERKVDLSRAEQRSLVQFVETVGVLEAEGQTDIAGGVTGLVDQVLFREGDEVGPETILVKVEQDKYESDVDLAEANVERARAALETNRELAERDERAGFGASAVDKAKSRGAVRLSEAELRAARAALKRAKVNLERSRVRAPYAGRINKRMVTPGTYLEEKTVIATIADLSRIRLVGYVPESTAPLVRQLIRTQEQRIRALRFTVPLLGLGSAPVPGASLGGVQLVQADHIVSGYDPEFVLLAQPHRTYFARIFYMSTVANPDTHMFEAKAEVLDWLPETTPPL